MANVVSNLVIQLQVTGAAQAKAQLASIQSAIAQLLGLTGAGGASAGGNIGGINVAALNIGAVGTINRIGGTGTVVNITSIGSANFTGNVPGQQNQNQRTGVNAVVDVMRVTQQVFREFIGVLRDFMALQKQIAVIQEMTGGTTKESGAIAMLMRAGGVTDTQGIRDIARMLRAQNQGAGLGATHLLGVHTTPGESGTAIMLDYIAALQKIQNSQRKFDIGTHVFGSRGMAQLEGMLNLLPETTQEIKHLADTMDTDLPLAVQRFTGEWQAFSETFEQDVIGPFLNEFLPLLTSILEDLTNIIQSVHDFLGDDLTGILEMVAAFTALGVAVMFLAVTALPALIAQMQALIATGIFTLLLNPGIAAAVAAIAVAGAAAGVGFGIGNYIDKHFIHPNDKVEENTKRAADYLEDIRATLMGNTGPNARRTISEIEKDYTLAHALGKGFA